MRSIHLAATTFALLLGVSHQAVAQVNHGDFLGTGVDFLQVTETTQTAGDPAVLWEAPVLSGTGQGLVFTPTAYLSSCNNGVSDATGSLLTTTIMAQGANTLDQIALVEGGDTILTAFPPFGTPATNSTAALSGFLTVTEDTGGPIAPVIIPFVGTFVPTGSFSLPGDFGTSAWTGSILIDVAAQVPNATKATLSLDNDLTTNCAPGNTAATIQKKSVAGPTAMIVVNPLPCELEIDKTCCITKPALPDLGQCEGDMISMTLEFTGDKCSASNNDQGYSFRCHGRRRIGDPADVFILYNNDITAMPDTGVLHGNEVTFTSSTGTLPERTKFKVKGPWWRKQYLKINTSCEKAFRCGDQFGAFKVTGFESTLGGVVDCSAPPPPPVCAAAGDPVGTPCDAKVIDMVLEYNGKICQDPLPNPQGGYANCEGNATGSVNVSIVNAGYYPYKTRITPASNINNGDRIRVSARWWGGLVSPQKYLITDAAGVQQEIEFKTSCSQPLALGDEFGSLKVVEFTTKSGLVAALGDGTDGKQDACEVPLLPPKPHCTSDLSEITLVYIGDYLGEGCTVSNAQSGYASCSGVVDPGDPVSVVAGSGLDAMPEDQIEFGDLVTITPSSGNELPWFTSLDVTGADGSQWIGFKTSCHKPLSLGDRFGSFVVFGMDREHDGPISLGGNVQYQYKVTNPNDDDVVVTVEDSELGTIAEDETVLADGGMVEFTKDATLFGTTTNVATVTGVIAGTENMCTMDMDSVTVTVTVPPSGSFTCACNQSLLELTLIWDGDEDVDVIAWDGQPGGTQLETFNGLVKGSQITVGGFTEDTAIYEIFEAGTANKLGESEFELTCRDYDMNGVNDCGKREGDGKYDDPTKINDWLLEGMFDDDENLKCSPQAVPPPPGCGFGPELMLVLPGLLWLHRRRMRKA